MHSWLAYMPVEQSPGGRESSVRQNGEEPPHSRGVPIRRGFSLRSTQVTIVGQLFPGRAKSILENDQTLVVQIRSSKIKSLCTPCFARFDEPPEKDPHTTEIVEAFVGTPILVNRRGSMPQGQQGSDRVAIFSRQTDLDPVLHTLHQISEPCARLRNQPMPPARLQQQTIKIVHQPLRATRFIGQAFPLGPLNLALNRVFVKSAPDLLQSSSQVEFVKEVRGSGLQTTIHFAQA